MIVPKIEIKVTANELKEAYATLDYNFPNEAFDMDAYSSRKMKSFHSLMEVIRIKLAKKHLSNKDKNKPFKLSFEYYEANFIHSAMMIIKLGHYAQSFFNKLDQKLA